MGVNVGKPDVLIKLDEENGKLTYGGVPVCDGEHSGGDTPQPAVSGKVVIVDGFDDLDTDAEAGSLALVQNPEFDLAALELDDYDADKDRYRIPNKLVTFAPQIEYRESVYTRALQNFLSKYPLQYYKYWSEATLSEWGRKTRGVFRQNGDGTYTDITSQFSVGDRVGDYWYATRDHCFYMEAEVDTTHKDSSTWDDEELYLSAIPILLDAQDNLFVRERIECEGIMSDGIVAPNATTKYLIGAMWDGDTRQRTFLEMFPGAEKIGGNIYRIPAIYLYAFEDMDGSFEYEQDDDSDKGYHMETVSMHLQAGWNVVFLLGALEYDSHDKRWELDNVSFDTAEPLDGAPMFSVLTDETGTLDFHREIDSLLFEGALVSRTEIHPSGLFIKTTLWRPINTELLPKVTSEDYSGDISELYERTDEIRNELDDNSPYHHNRYLLDNLYDEGGALAYNGQRMRTLQSIRFNCRYDGYDEYILFFADGSADSLHVLHTPVGNGNAVTGISFYTSGAPYIDGCAFQFEDGSERFVSLSGLDMHVAFANVNEDPEVHEWRQFGDTRVYLKIGGSNPTISGYSQFIDLGEGDRNTAKLDYIDMMMGTGFETERLYSRAERNYHAGFWTEEHLRQAVTHGWIDDYDFFKITGLDYEPDDEPYDDPDDEPDDDPDDEPYDGPDDDPDDEPYEEESNDDQD